MLFCSNDVRKPRIITKAALEMNALAINLFTILPVADADNANGEIALGAGKQQSVSKPRIYFCDLLHRRTAAIGSRYLSDAAYWIPSLLLLVIYLYASKPD